VHLALLVRRLADVDGPRRVRAVAVPEAAEVEHDHVAVLDLALAELVVRAGAVRARADDGEVDLRVSVLACPCSLSRRCWAGRARQHLRGGG
jgi:hypothetical protein